MKFIAFLIICILSSVTLCAQQGDTTKLKRNDKMLVAEAACGQCQFQLKGEGCDLAVKINGKAYYVDGSSIDDHGDAHAEDGFCNATRKARVKGKVVKGRFKATYFALVPAE